MSWDPKIDSHCNKAYEGWLCSFYWLYEYCTSTYLFLWYFLILELIQKVFISWSLLQLFMALRNLQFSRQIYFLSIFCYDAIFLVRNLFFSLLKTRTCKNVSKALIFHVTFLRFHNKINVAILISEKYIFNYFFINSKHF